jgi:hypothetical protein
MSDAVQGEPPSVRIGHAERQAAVEALKHHHEAGRIDSQEYEARSVKAGATRSRAELEALFTDLPLPHGASGSLEGAHRTVAPEHARRGVLNVPEPLATTIVSMAPILAVILFFVTGSWLWFLAIPLVGIVIYGSESSSDRESKAARRKRRRDR